MAARPHQIMVPVGRDVPLTIPIDHGGPNVLELEVEAGPQELTLANNRAAVVVNGVRDRLRVLLVSGEPHAGERVWRNILKSDPSVDLVHFTILRPPEKQDGTPIRELSLIAFPIRELFDVKLDDFDLIIFDRYSRRGIIPQAYIENVVRYVRNGGAFLEAAGPSFGTPMSLFRTPLGEILPTEPTGNVDEEGFKPQLTDLGRRHPVTEDLPGAGKPGEQPSWGRWFRQVDARVHHGNVVMSGDHGEPLLVLDRVGKGRVAQLLSDQMWLWARGFEGGGPQAELLRRLAYWLMKEPDLEENDLRAAIEGDRLKVTRQSLEPDDRPVTVTAPDGTTIEPDADRRGTAGAAAAPRRSRRWVSTGSPTASIPRSPRRGRSTRSNSPMSATTPDKLLPLVEGERRRRVLGRRRHDPGGAPRLARPHRRRPQLDGHTRERRLPRHRVQRNPAVPGARRPAAGGRPADRRLAPRRPVEPVFGRLLERAITDGPATPAGGSRAARSAAPNRAGSPIAAGSGRGGAACRPGSRSRSTISRSRPG